MAYSGVSIRKLGLGVFLFGLLAANAGLAEEHDGWRLRKTACSRTTGFRLARGSFERATALAARSNYQEASLVLDRGIAALGGSYLVGWNDGSLTDDTDQALEVASFAKRDGKMRYSVQVKLDALEDRLDLCSRTSLGSGLHHALLMGAR